MKRYLKVIILLLTVGPRPAFADSLLDQFYGGFVGNAKFAIESTSDGTAHPEFLDNFFEIGNIKGQHLAAIDAGISGTILPDSAQLRSAEWTTGGKIHLSPLIKNYVKLPDQWQFLNTLEIDARGSYNWTLKHPFWGIVMAYPFK